MERAVRSRYLRAALAGRYWRAESAEVVVRAWEQSGEALTAFARRHGMHPARLMRWRARLRPEGAAAVRFHAVTIRDSRNDDGDAPLPIPVENGSGLELILTTGHRISIRRGFDAAVLAELLRVLASERC
jgi:hypothetical protein